MLGAASDSPQVVSLYRRRIGILGRVPSTLPRKFGRFELIESASKGGMAEVYRARVVGGTRSFALKKLPEDSAADPMLRAMFVDEARMAQSVLGPNLARLVDHGDAEGEHYLLFEWIDAVSLEVLLRALEDRGERLQVDQVARLFALVADLLDRIHGTIDPEGQPTRMVHRDVSPGNILIDADGEPHLIDFGLSRSTLQRKRTDPGLVKGKFGYLAPEQLDGIADERTDLFALGICFYETLTGARLFDSPTIDASIAALRSFSGVQSIRMMRPDVPEALDEVLCKLLAPKPADRYESAADVRRAIFGAKPALLLSGEDIDESNGVVVTKLFPELSIDERARYEARLAANARRRMDEPPKVDVGQRVAGLLMLSVVVVLAIFVGVALMMH